MWDLRSYIWQYLCGIYIWQTIWQYLCGVLHKAIPVWDARKSIINQPSVSNLPPPSYIHISPGETGVKEYAVLNHCAVGFPKKWAVNHIHSSSIHHRFATWSSIWMDFNRAKYWILMIFDDSKSDFNHHFWIFLMLTVPSVHHFSSLPVGPLDLPNRSPPVAMDFPWNLKGKIIDSENPATLRCDSLMIWCKKMHMYIYV